MLTRIPEISNPDHSPSPNHSVRFRSAPRRRVDRNRHAAYDRRTMTVQNELVFDRNPANPTDGPNVRVGRMLGGTAVLIVVVIAIGVQLVSAPTPQEGRQATPAESFALERAALSGWELLVSMSGEQRAGYPPPMIWADDRVCIGFARLDYGPDDFRPGLARCERVRAGTIGANEIRSLISVTAGFDTWHFIEAANHIDSIKVYLASGERVSDDRILLLDSIGALRLENDRDLATVEWSTRTATYRCQADPTAWRSSVFCAE